MSSRNFQQIEYLIITLKCVPIVCTTIPIMRANRVCANRVCQLCVPIVCANCVCQSCVPTVFANCVCRVCSSTVCQPRVIRLCQPFTNHVLTVLRYFNKSPFCFIRNMLIKLIDSVRLWNMDRTILFTVIHRFKLRRFYSC